MELVPVTGEETPVIVEQADNCARDEVHECTPIPVRDESTISNSRFSKMSKRVKAYIQLGLLVLLAMCAVTSFVLSLFKEGATSEEYKAKSDHFLKSFQTGFAAGIGINQAPL